MPSTDLNTVVRKDFGVESLPSASRTELVARILLLSSAAVDPVEDTHSQDNAISAEGPSWIRDTDTSSAAALPINRPVVEGVIDSEERVYAHRGQLLLLHRSDQMGAIGAEVD